MIRFLKRYRYLRESRKRNRRILSDPAVFPKVGLVLDLEFHYRNRWVSAVTPYMMDALIRDIPCVVIRSQEEYDAWKDHLDAVISTEVGWSAPSLRYDPGKPPVKYILLSDPHRDPEGRQKYILGNSFSYILAYYHFPTLYHFRDIPAERIVHFPWAIPDEHICDDPVEMRGDDFLLIHGGSKSGAYELRNWCRRFDFVKNADHSGVENKILSDKGYFDWLRGNDAAIAAGSLAPEYRLVIPKYFEIAAMGCLLFAQEAEDLALLGFRDGENCVVFNQQTFLQKATSYLADREAYVPVRERGRKLIAERHTVSSRVDFLKKHILDALAVHAHGDGRH